MVSIYIRMQKNLFQERNTCNLYYVLRTKDSTEEEDEGDQDNEVASAAPAPAKKAKGLLPTLLKDLGRKRREGVWN